MADGVSELMRYWDFERRRWDGCGRDYGVSGISHKIQLFSAMAFLRCSLKGHAEQLGQAAQPAKKKLCRSGDKAHVEAAAREALSALQKLSPLEYCKGTRSRQKLRCVLAKHRKRQTFLEAQSIEDDLVQQLQSEAENVAAWADCLDLVKQHMGTSTLMDMQESMIQKVMQLPEHVVHFLILEAGQQLLQNTATSAGAMTARFMNFICMEGEGLFMQARGCVKEAALLQLQSKLLSMWIASLSRSTAVEKHLAAIPERLWLPTLAGRCFTKGHSVLWRVECKITEICCRARGL